MTSGLRLYRFILFVSSNREKHFTWHFFNEFFKSLTFRIFWKKATKDGQLNYIRIKYFNDKEPLLFLRSLLPALNLSFWISRLQGNFNVHLVKIACMIWICHNKYKNNCWCFGWIMYKTLGSRLFQVHK